MDFDDPQYSGRAPGRLRRRQHRQDLFGGYLETEQRLEWRGRSPSPARIEQLPALFTREHFAEVERCVAGLLRCERDGDRIACRILNRWPGLIFADDGSESDAQAVTQRWRILGGLLAQPQVVEHGVLTLGFEVKPLSEETAILALWARVEGFPSRFLAPCPLIGVRGLWRLAGRIYAAYHRWVTFRYLVRMARLLDGTK